jgi:hypothetical protein
MAPSSNSPLRVPKPTPSLATRAEQLERRRQVRGLLLLVALVLLFTILRAGVHRVFTHGWWRLW